MNARASAEKERLFTIHNHRPESSTWMRNHLIPLVGAHWCRHCFGCLVSASGKDEQKISIPTVQHLLNGTVRGCEHNEDVSQGSNGIPISVVAQWY